MKNYLILALSLSASSAFAHNADRIEYARVIGVEPVYHTQVRQERQCYQNDRPANTLGGAVLGAVIANQVSHHNDAATVAGAIIGGTLGHQAPTEVTCVRQPRYESVLSGYQVSYRYKGEIYQTFSREHPGKRIEISQPRHKRIYLHH